MKREILFRGFNEKNNKWLYGYYFVNRGQHLVVADEIQTNPLVNWTDFVVDPNTIGQYTGLTDKNGKKIFEGDIVTGRNCRFVVKYDERKAEFVAVNSTLPKGFGLSMSQTWINGTNKIICGNIHDNPELMK
ncbi:MAG: hypothetical protein HXN96_08030 [Prevotella salivae]|nr:hypothetical protein [Segatella salivae]